MELTPSSLKLFNDEHFNIMNMLNIADGKYLRNGSFAKTLWASDVDLYQSVDVKTKSELIAFLDKLRTLLSTMIKNPTISVQEIKVGETKYASHKRIASLTNKKIIKDLSTSDKKRIKLDLIAVMNGYLEDITMIWDIVIPNQPLEEFATFKTAMLKDIKKYYDQGRLYKVLKRIQSLLNVKKDVQPLSKTEEETLVIINDLTQNTRLGMTYLTISRLQSLIDAKHIPKADVKLASSNIKEDIAIKLQLPEVGKQVTSSPSQVIKMLTHNLNEAIASRVSTLLSNLRIK